MKATLTDHQQAGAQCKLSEAEPKAERSEVPLSGKQPRKVKSGEEDDRGVGGMTDEHKS